MTNCPPKLRGDLSKWLCEINTGVYVGNVSSRVRDALWERVCQNLKNGQATMVFTTAGEQRMDFRTHNTTWEMVDFDGIKLMRRPLPQMEQNQLDLKPGFSKAAQWQAARKAGRTQRGRADYTVIDLETTGLKAASDAIIEYGALRVRDGVPVEELTMRVRSLKSRSYSSSISSPRSFIGTTRNLMPLRACRSCQLTMLEWCSISLRMTSSPLRMKASPKQEATRLMLSVVPRVNTISAGERAFRKRRTVSRAASCSSVACCERKCTPRCTLAFTL